MNPLNTDSGRSDRRQFQIVCCLGRGGFGEVYKAVLHSSGGVRTDVAIKVLHAEADPRSQAVQRLRDEGRLLGAIHHPSVLKVHDLCVLAGRVGLVTEYVDGQDLDKLFHGDDPPGERALIEVMGHVASALNAAWSSPGPDGKTPLHLIHRDIKPPNIRVGTHGEVKLLDFGIARANLGREAQTESQALLGSYLYMAPERFLENEAHVTCASDVFALGVTWYESMTRRRLFAEFGLQQVYLLVLNRPRFDAHVLGRLALLPATTDARVVELLRGMLEYEPAERPWPAELARICQDLGEELPGKSLQRWAAARTWPAPKTVQGVLDGEVITEARYPTDGAEFAKFEGSSQPVTNPTLERPGRKPGNRLQREPARSVAPTSEREARARPRPPHTPEEAPEATVLSPVIRLPATQQPQVSGVISRRLASPEGKVALGLAMGGTAGVATIAALLLTAAVVVLALTWGGPSHLRRPEPVHPAPTVAEPAPRPAPVPRPTPAPVASPAPESRAPNPAPVEPVPVRALPSAPVVAPLPVPVAAPLPAPATETGTVAITGGVLVELRQGGVVRRPGVIPVGTYEVWADVEGVGQLARITVFRLDPDARILVACSKLRRECHVQ